MTRPAPIFRLLALLALLCRVGVASAAGPPVLRIAVASNFAGPARELAARFEAKQGVRVLLAFGSTGKHAAQIEHGAPFALFLAADAERPRRLEASGRAVAGTRATYALGRLVLWSPEPGRVDATGEVLARGEFERLAIANPRLAPYGRAAREALEALGLWERLAPRTVRGENIAQAHQFVESGNAELGLVAASQVLRPGREAPGSSWEVPARLHGPIEQQAVLLEDTPAARAFLAFLLGEEAGEIIQRWGYGRR
ncbi:MAG: molybdate ABC transporter substrate-binding protein [Deltaproteobacteria bacterium]|nr:molybdate ABC transporter substrate-binding protein [Deltaproteobacteria bacterium]